MNKISIPKELFEKEYLRIGHKYQQGGNTKSEINNSEILTGKFAIENPQGNVNVEKDEFIKHNKDGNIQKAVGKDHENGGINLNLEDAKVLSDFTKIGAKNAKELKDRYKLSVKATDTFAKVMDKMNKKLGVDEAIEEQAKALEGIGKNETVKDSATKRLNETVLIKEVQEYENKLEQLKGAQNFVFEDIFKRQESIPKRGNGELINEDGSQMKVKNQGVNVAQQGGRVEELANKYGISPERANQLISMQQGGEMQQGISPEEVITAFAEATQQDPQAIAEQLQQLSPEEQQAALAQMVQALQQEQQPEMQQGGKVYMQQAGDAPKIDPKYAFFTPGTYDLTPEQQLEEDYLHQPFVKGYENYASGGVNPEERVAYQSSQMPYLVEDSGMYSDKKVNLKNVGAFQQKWASYRDSVEKAVAANPYLSEEQKKNYLEKLTQEKFKLSYNAEKNKNKNAGGFDAVYGRETSEKGGFNLPLITVEDKKKYPNIKFIGDVLDKKTGKVKAEYKDLDPTTVKTLEDTYKTTDVSGRDIGLGLIQTAKAAMPEYDYGDGTTQPAQPVAPDNTFGFTPYITPPTPRQGVILETATAPRYERAKRALEPGQAALADQLETRRQQIVASGLAPMHQEALMANEAANAQNIANQNVASVEGFNAQNQATTANKQADADFKTNLFNINQRDMFFQRNTAAQDNWDLAQKQYNDAYNKLGYRTIADNRDLATTNAMFSDMRINRDGSVTHIPQPTTEAPDNTAWQEWYDKLSAPEQEDAKKAQTAEILLRINAKKKADALKNKRVV